MSEEETAYVGNWKEDLIAEYVRLENQKADAEYILNHDYTIVELVQKRILIDQEIAVYEEIPRHTIATTEQQQATIKSELAEKWDTEDKTFKCDAGTATLRITKSLNIRNKGKLIEFLTTIKKLPEYIKSFETAKLRKIKDAGLIGDEIAIWDEKKSVAISIKEAEQ